MRVLFSTRDEGIGIKFVRFMRGVDVTFLLRNKNVTSTPLMKRTNLIPIPSSLVENRTLKLSPREAFYAKKAIMVLHKNIKKRIRLSDIY